MTLQQLQSKIQNAEALDFGDIFSKSIELFKKVWVQGLIVLILTGVLMMPFYFILYIPLIAAGIIDPDSLESGSEPNPVVMIPFFLLMLVFGFIVIAIALAFKAAFYRICRNKDLGLTDSDDYFYYFKKPYLGKVIKLGAITILISFLAMMLCGLPLIYAIVPLGFINVVFAFNPDLNEGDIVKASFSLGNKKWLLAFGLAIVSGFLAQIVGVLLCFVGILVTASFSYIPWYFIYKQTVGFESDDEIQQIGTVEEL